MSDTAHCPRCGCDLGRAFRHHHDAGVSTGVQDRILIDNLRAEIGQLRSENKRLRRKGSGTWHSVSDVPPPIHVRVYTWWPHRELDDDDMPTGPIVGGDCFVAMFNGSRWEGPEWFENYPNADYWGHDYEHAFEPMFWTALPADPPQVAALTPGATET